MSVQRSFWNDGQELPGALTNRVQLSRGSWRALSRSRRRNLCPAIPWNLHASQRQSMRVERAERSLTLNSSHEALQLNAQQVTSMNARPPVTVQWLSSDHEAEWDAFVGRHELGLVYDLSAWKRTLEEAFPHIRGRFLALREKTSGQIVAGLPVYQVRSWLLGNRIVSVPFLSFCNPLVSNESQLNLLLADVVEEYHRNGSDRLEIRMTEATRQLSHPHLSPSARPQQQF